MSLVIVRILLEKCHIWCVICCKYKNVTYLQKCKKTSWQRGTSVKGRSSSRQKIQVVSLGDRNCISIHTLAVVLGPLKRCLWHNAEGEYLTFLATLFCCSLRCVLSDLRCISSLTIDKLTSFPYFSSEFLRISKNLLRSIIKIARWRWSGGVCLQIRRTTLRHILIHFWKFQKESTFLNVLKFHLVI